MSQLIDSNGQVEASYGYTPYGATDARLTKGELQGIDQLNPYRYSGRRFDTGSGTIDMGARRFGPDTGRFLQPDVYQGALANLGLSMDSLSGNRYALAAGNPVSFVEVDGHMLAKGPGGGGMRIRGGPESGDPQLPDVGNSAPQVDSPAPDGPPPSPSSLFSPYYRPIFGPPTPEDPLNQAYIHTFNVGEGGLDEARAMMANLFRDPNRYFPFEVSLVECPKRCDEPIYPGNVLFLSDSGTNSPSFLRPPGTVKVAARGSTGFQFVALDDHIAAGGTVSFFLSAFDEINDGGGPRLQLQVIGYTAGQGLEGQRRLG